MTPCLGCGQLTSKGPRCFKCSAAHEARRNASTRRRELYGGAWRAFSKAQRAGRVCARCGTTKDLTLDHVVPGDPRETRVLCRPCNSSKGGGV